MRKTASCISTNKEGDIMTLATMWFNAQKKKGKVHKVGKGCFHNGRVYTERVVWFCEEDQKCYVWLNGNVWTYRHPHYNKYGDLWGYV